MKQPVHTRFAVVTVAITAVLLTRGVWLALVILTLGTFFASLPVYLALLQTPCAGTTCGYEQLSAGQIGTLKGIGLSIGDYAAYSVALTCATVAVCVVVSTLIIGRRSDDRMARLVALMLVAFGPIIATSSVSTNPSPWQVPNACLTFLALALLILVFSLFPSGRWVPSFTRWILVVCLAGSVPWIFFLHAPFMRNTSVSLLSNLLSLTVLAILAVVQIYRYRHLSSPLQRQQTKWVVFGIAVPIAFYVSGTALHLMFPALADLGSPGGSRYQLAFAALNSFVPLFIPLSFGFALLRYRLWEIDIIINRTLVYGALTALIVGVYVLVVGLLSTLLHMSGNFLISLLATGIIAVLFQPLRARLQRMINRLMYGERDDPYAVLSRLGSRLEATLVPEALLPTIVETIAQALKLPYAALALKQGDAFSVTASYGLPQGQPLILPLIYHAETIGQLLLGPRALGDSFTAADRGLLEAIARQAGVAVHAVRLAADLQHSREQLVTTREEERRRLRRGLHDELGPTLASMTLKLDAARLLLTQNPPAVDPLLAELKTHMQATIADIRRLAYDLRPPTLDELGLVSALREQAAHSTRLNGVHVSIEAPQRLSPLPAAVEVAAYRIVLEALTNVARHAQAHSCCIRLALTDVLAVEVSDDGLGLPKNHHAGVGITSMRERAAELGGTCVIESGATGGTHILVRLPVAKE